MNITKQQLRIIAGMLLVIAILSMFQEQLCIKMEGATMLILCLAAFLFVVPNLSSISKFKVGDVELEFKQEIDKLEKLVKQEEISKPSFIPRFKVDNKESWQYYYNEYQDILKSKSTNLEKILKASQLIEHMIVVAGKDFGIDPEKIKIPYDIIKELERMGLISHQELNLYREFLSIRNKVIHGDLSILDDSLTVRILDLLGRIVRIFG